MSVEILTINRFPSKPKKYQWLYEGQILNNKFHGFGVLTKINEHGTYKKYYAGNWINNKKHGFGRCWYDNNDFYEGNYYNNKRHGFGRMWYNNGDFYQGTWNNNLYDGDGLLVLSDKNRYEGQFKLGKKNGTGIFYHLKTGQMQEGYWVNGHCKSSIIKDIPWRQSAVKPTPYPIPNLISNINVDLLEQLSIISESFEVDSSITV